MDFAILIPISLFACIAYSIKVIADAYTRRRIIASHGSEDLLRSLLLGEATRRRHASLHWGCVLTLVAIAFGVVEAMGVDQVTPGVVGLLVGATGLGNLVFYFLEGRVSRPVA